MFSSSSSSSMVRIGIATLSTLSLGDDTSGNFCLGSIDKLLKIYMNNS